MQTVDITKKSIEELKAIAFDLSRQGELININYKAVRQEIEKKEQEAKKGK